MSQPFTHRRTPRREQTVGDVLRWWWREPFEYDWLHGYAQSRAWLHLDTTVTAAGYTLFAALSATLLLTASPTPLTLIIASVATVVFTVIASWWWMTPTWPTQRASLRMTATSEVSLAALLVASSSWLPAQALLSLYLLPGMYIVFVHGPRALAVHHAWVVAAVMITGCGVLADGSVAPATAALLGVQFFASCGGLTAAHISVTLERAGARASLTDPLTGLLNRRGLHMVSERLLSHQPMRCFVTVTLIDLDDFKPYNDSHGHREGDNALKEVAALLTQIYEPHEGAIARIGGDEFLAISHLDSAPAAALAQHLLNASTTIDTLTPLTISIGTHTSRELCNHPAHTTIDDMIARADRALYEAKQAGGNTAIATD